MDCSMPGFPVHDQLLELSQIHVHQVGDTIQPSHPLSSPSPPAFSLSQNQGLFQWVNSSHQVAQVSASASVLPMTIQDWFPLGWTVSISLLSKGFSSVFSNTTVQKHQFLYRKLIWVELNIQILTVRKFLFSRHWKRSTDHYLWTLAIPNNLDTE